MKPLFGKTLHIHFFFLAEGKKPNQNFNKLPLTYKKLTRINFWKSAFIILKECIYLQNPTSNS